MLGLKRIAPVALMAALVLGCADDPSSGTPDTTGTSRALLTQPRAKDVSTLFDPSGLATGEPSLSVAQLGMNLGSLDAPVKVIEFVDFGCGFCRKFQIETFPTLRAEFIETSMVEWKFMPFISGMFGNSAVVTEAAECALDQDARFFAALSDRLWADQATWKGSSEPEALVRGWATMIGADGNAFDQCMRDDRSLERVTSATALAAELGVRSTPTFWIVGFGPVQGALPLSAFQDLFTQVHAEVTGTAG